MVYDKTESPHSTRRLHACVDTRPGGIESNASKTTIHTEVKDLFQGNSSHSCHVTTATGDALIIEAQKRLIDTLVAMLTDTLEAWRPAK